MIYNEQIKLLKAGGCLQSSLKSFKMLCFQVFNN